MKKTLCIIVIILVIGGLTVHYESGDKWYHNSVDIRWRTTVLQDRFEVIKLNFEDQRGD